MLVWLSDKDDSGVLAVFASEQRLTPFKNAMEQEEEGGKKRVGESIANEMGGPSASLISHLY